jgi:hypothetical protein
MPSVQKAHEFWQGKKDVHIVTIAIDGDAADVIAPFLTAKHYTFPTMLGNWDLTRKFTPSPVPVPATYIVDRQGRMLAFGQGPVDLSAPAMTEYLQHLVAQPRG